MVRVLPLIDAGPESTLKPTVSPEVLLAERAIGGEGAPGEDANAVPLAWCGQTGPLIEVCIAADREIVEGRKGYRRIRGAGGDQRAAALHDDLRSLQHLDDGSRIDGQRHSRRHNHIAVKRLDLARRPCLAAE